MFFLLPMAIHTDTPALVTLDPSRRIATLRDGAGRLKLSLNYDNRCLIDAVEVLGRQVVARDKGIWSGIRVGGSWYTTSSLDHPPKASRSGNHLQISGIEYAGGGVRVAESWFFDAGRDSVRWKIVRRYLDRGTLEDTAMPNASFETMTTWTGALLGTGGVAWAKLFDAPNATYGVHTGSATLWNAAADGCLRFAAIDEEAVHKALRFTREPDGGFSMAASVTTERREPKVGLARFLRDRQDVWTAFDVAQTQTASATYEMEARDYRQAFGRGDFKGLDTNAITELLDTIGRIGVVDEGIVGSNGWYSGYAVLHEPWLSRVGTALDDPNYLRSSALFLDYAREHAILPDGMVKSRWKYDGGDALPGTYDEKSGFYEAQWGRLMDSQSSYVTNVADQFDLSGDKAWVVRQKIACEAALEYLLRRDGDGDHLVEMANDSTSQRKSSDWLDIVWASHENAFVNAQLYGALIKWAKVEGLLGDGAKALRYRDYAANLKASFNKSVADGGFWNPTKGWYAYWRDADGSVHGDNLVVPVNLTALGEGLCDDPERRRILLDNIEERMKRESLLAWPACFEGYAPGEGADDVFPTYENGDIFLAWAEYGVRAYASTDPGVALKYVRRIVDRYKQDGLAFQRYLRSSGKGAGDDILANNCNVVTGLYRDIFGIQPRYNRLYLDPHLVPDLDGTRVRYNLRGRILNIDLSVGAYRIESEGISVRDSRPFGVAFGPHRFTYFPGDRDEPAMSIQVPPDGGLDATFDGGGWTIATERNHVVATHTFHDLRAGARYRIVSSGRTIAKVSADNPAAKIDCKAGPPMRLELVTD